MQMTESSYGTMVVTGVTRLIVGSVMSHTNQKPKTEKDEEKIE
jgi:hypothetical protein